MDDEEPIEAPKAVEKKPKIKPIVLPSKTSRAKKMRGRYEIVSLMNPGNDLTINKKNFTKFGFSKRVNKWKK